MAKPVVPICLAGNYGGRLGILAITSFIQADEKQVALDFRAEHGLLECIGPVRYVPRLTRDSMMNLGYNWHLNQAGVPGTVKG